MSENLNPIGGTPPGSLTAADAAEKIPFGDTSGNRGPDALDEIPLRIKELREYALCYVKAHFDKIDLALKKAAVASILGIAGFFIMAAALVTATVLTLTGLSGALSDLFGDRLWTGRLIIGVLMLVAFTAGSLFVLKRSRKMFLKQKVKKYQEQKKNQEATYGHQVSERAGSVIH